MNKKNILFHLYATNSGLIEETGLIVKNYGCTFNYDGIIQNHKAIYTNENAYLLLYLNNNYILNNTKFYISFWLYRLKEKPIANSYEVLFGLDTSCFNAIQILDRPSAIYNSVGMRYNHNYINLCSTTFIKTNKWYHVYIDNDGNNLCNIYINGIKEGSLNANIRGPLFLNNVITIGTFGGGLRKGDFSFIGYLDDIYFVIGEQLFTSNFNINDTILPSSLYYNFETKRNIYNLNNFCENYKAFITG